MVRCRLCPELGRLARLFAAAFLWPAPYVAAQPAAPQAVDTAMLARKVAQLEAELQALKPPAVEQRDLKPQELRFSGFVQADAALYDAASEDELDPSTRQPLNATRFFIRRARLRTEAAYGFLGAAFEIDGNTVAGPVARILGAEVSARFSAGASRVPYLLATVGLFKIPFGREVLQSDSDRLYLERSSVIRALFPGEFDLGLQLSGGWRFLRYAVAVMNGEPAGEAGFPGRDPNQSKDLVARLGVDARLAAPVQLFAGVSGCYGSGFHPGTPATKDVLTWRDDNDDGTVQLSEIQAIAGSAATPSQNFTRGAVGVDARLRWEVPKLGALELVGEVVWASNLDRGLWLADPVSAGRDLREFGWYLGVTQELTRYARIGLRYDFYDPDADADEQRGAARVPLTRASSTLAVVAAAQHARYGRLSIEYDHSRNALGRRPSGAPTTLGRDALLLRAQLVF